MKHLFTSYLHIQKLFLQFPSQFFKSKWHHAKPHLIHPICTFLPHIKLPKSKKPTYQYNFPSFLFDHAYFNHSFKRHKIKTYIHYLSIHSTTQYHFNKEIYPYFKAIATHGLQTSCFQTTNHIGTHTQSKQAKTTIYHTISQ